jgi:hypothetical protein
MKGQRFGNPRGKLCNWMKGLKEILRRAWALGGLPRLRWLLKKSLEDLDREIRKAQQPNSVDSSRRDDGRLDVDALASNKELRLLISLHLDGWTWPEISRHLRGK